MEILDYDSEQELLYIRYSTKNVWVYTKVAEDVYKQIQAAESDKATHKILRNHFAVGVQKGANA